MPIDPRIKRAYEERKDYWLNWDMNNYDFFLVEFNDDLCHYVIYSKTEVMPFDLTTEVGVFGTRYNDIYWPKGTLTLVHFKLVDGLPYKLHKRII